MLDILRVWPEQYRSSLQTREDSTYKFPTYIPIFLTLTNHLTNLRILQNTPDGARATSVAYIIQQVAERAKVRCIAIGA